MRAKQREIKYEILRIVAMMMIIILHYLSKGGFLVPLSEEPSAITCLSWMIEAFCLVAVNVYVLISGYFGYTAEWKIKKAVTLWLQVFFYAFAVGVFMLSLGIADRSAFTVYEGIKLLFPIVTEHYWFATSYLLLFLMMPFLKAGIDKVSKKELTFILGILILLQSVMKSVLPVHLPWDKLGYDAWWFVTVFLIGAYIRKYGCSLLEKKAACLIGYVAFSGLTFVTAIGISLIYRSRGSLEEFITYTYSYNHIFCLLASISLFGIVKNHKEKVRKQQTEQVIRILSGATFGVYLLHEHIFIRYQWPVWLGTEQLHKTYLFLPHMAVCVVLVYATGTIIELLRQKLFCLIHERR